MVNHVGPAEIGKYTFLEKKIFVALEKESDGALEAWDFQWKISFSYLVGIPAIPKAFGIIRYVTAHGFKSINAHNPIIC